MLHYQQILETDCHQPRQVMGKERLIETIGREEVIETIGREKVIETIGREKVLETLFPNLTKEQIKKIIEQKGNR